MAEIPSLAEYFEQVIPQQFAAALADAPEGVADQPELIEVYEITGEGGGIYRLRSVGTQLDIALGDADGADMHTIVTLDDWRISIATGLIDPFVDYVSRRKVEIIKSLKGTVRLDLTRPDGSIWQSATVFGGQAEPEVTLHMNSDDYIAMMRGDLNGQMAFMTGKLRFDGSLPLLMQIGALSA
jgi:hypothetical protein